MEKISVIIPTYNRASMLRAAIESVQAQTKAADEIIIVDDGSTDETPQLIRHISFCSPVSIMYLHQDNKGPAAARNYGIRSASHAILAFLDADDHWHKRKLEIQFNAMQAEPQYIISHTAERWIRRGKHLNQKKKHQPPHGYIFEQCLKLCCVGMSTVMLRRALFDTYGYFDEVLRCCEDYDYWLRLSVYERFLLVDRQLTIKQGGRRDQVSFIYRVGMDRFRIQSMRNLLKKNPLTLRQKEAACMELREKCRVYGTGCIKHGKTEEGRYYLHLAQLLSPEN